MALCGAAWPRSAAIVALAGVVTPAAMTRPGGSVSRTSMRGVNNISTWANTVTADNECQIAEVRLPRTEIRIVGKGKDPLGIMVGY